MVNKTISREIYNKLARLSAQGIILVALTFLGLILGNEIDEAMGLIPTFSVLFLVIGFGLGIKGFYICITWFPYISIID